MDDADYHSQQAHAPLSHHDDGPDPRQERKPHTRLAMRMFSDSLHDRIAEMRVNQTLDGDNARPFAACLSDEVT